MLDSLQIVPQVLTWQVIEFIALGPVMLLITRFLVYGRAYKQLLEIVWLIPVGFTLLVLSKSAIHGIELGAILQCICAIAAIRYVRSYHREAFAHRSDAEETKLTWLYPALILMIILAVSLLIIITFVRPGKIVSIVAEVVAYNGVALCLITLIKALFVKRIYRDLATAEAENWQPVIAVDANKRQAAKSLFRLLEDKINAQKLYQQSDLTLKDLTVYFNVQERDIVQAISQEAGLNFCDFINSHRIWSIKRAIDSGLVSIEKVMEAGLDAGFFTKESFVHVFKRFVGKKPSGYIEWVKHRGKHP